jgi:hypothetical protein
VGTEVGTRPTADRKVTLHDADSMLASITSHPTGASRRREARHPSTSGREQARRETACLRRFTASAPCLFPRDRPSAPNAAQPVARLFLAFERRRCHDRRCEVRCAGWPPIAPVGS